VRRVVISGLQPQPGDEEGLGWLKEQLAYDPDAQVRQEAMRVWSTAEPSHTEEVAVLRDRAEQDDAGQVRLVALELLSRAEPKMQQFLQQRASDDPDPTVRAAVNAWLGGSGYL
jgi:hypothetical protein